MKRYLPLLLIIVTVGAGCASEPAPNYRPPGTVKAPAGAMLDLSSKGLTSIPEDTFSKTDLTRLDLSRNGLTAVQSQIGQLTELKFLDLSDNALTGIPAELGQLKKLETLDLSNNQLTGLPMELGNLTRLRILDVSGNAYSEQDLNAIAKKLIYTDIRK